MRSKKERARHILQDLKKSNLYWTMKDQTEVEILKEALLTMIQKYERAEKRAYNKQN